jgi:hypothetical protein
MSEGSFKKFFTTIILWLVITLIIAIAYKYFFKPTQESKIEELTSAQSQYDHEVTIDLDAFSGYCVFRSETFKNELKDQKIRLTLRDDGADYKKRIKELQKGNCQFALFTIDSNILSSVELEDFPGTIILVIDESKGADAVVAYKSAMPNLNSLDDSTAKIVLTPSSPSEFMARIIRANFSLVSLQSNYVEEAEGSREVLKKFLKANKFEKKAYIMWEPDVSRALEEPDAHILLDSSKIKGYIVDVLIIQRKYLIDHQDVARKVVEAYFKSLYEYKDKMIDLVIGDAKLTGGNLTKKQAENTVNGIIWKNTVENYAHFGLLDVYQAKGLDNLEDIIERIADVLVKTKAITTDPLKGKYNTLFFPGVLADLKKANFHPGTGLNIIESSETSENIEVRVVPELPLLEKDQWEQLVPVGRMNINPVSFGRGKSKIGIQSKRDLLELANKLKAWPRYYIVVVGQARREGDPDLNKELARERAEAVLKFLVKEGGINPNRIKAKVAKIFIRGGEGQSVSFVVGEMPY